MAENHKNKKLKKKRISFPQVQSQRQADDLEIENFRIISDWYHIAILELAETESFQSDFKWIAKELGLTQLEAKLAVERLLATNLLTSKDGKYQKTKQKLNTCSQDKTNAALIKYQKQILEKAIESIETDPLPTRNMTGMSMAIDPEKMPLAKKMIQEFMADLCDFLEADNKKQVYQLSVNLFPLQKNGENNE